jgi:hypothetical protein
MGILHAVMAKTIEIANTRSAMDAVADAPDAAGAVNSAASVAMLVAEIYRLGEEGLRLQVEASRMARESRPAFDAWFEAGLMLRRTSERLTQILRGA